MCAHYHIHADPKLAKENESPNVIEMRRFPCFFNFFLEKLEEPIETRYTGTHDTCIYWEIFEGANDWKLIMLVPKSKVYRKEDDIAHKEFAMRGIGEHMADQTSVGQVGGYITDNDTHDYYLYKCTGLPLLADKDVVYKVDGNEIAVKEGEKYCHGVWLDQVLETSKWFVMIPLCYIARMQVVMDADIEMLHWSQEENQSHSNLRSSTAREY